MDTVLRGNAISFLSPPDMPHESITPSLIGSFRVIPNTALIILRESPPSSDRHKISEWPE